ncbi:mechanosensitive ion channel family protein [Belliella sp. R4-6]|uniref:Mechanosensitive ion channel family protein n=1 Tax=Belliella alkalica TaxID=1730871 RepID=A0ABS9VAP2_9BACT|nr:mechanosensitive ion channel domain-containing protein [Belliella alkalica]MCH7413481.1 mechanosensitive ion channel family protein [Belliella alkalica]
MNLKKSAAQVIENKKRRVFLIKLAIFLLLLILIPIFQTLVLDSYFINQLFTSLLFLLGSNLIISLARMLTARFYMRRIKEDRVHGNFLLGITWISNILNAIVFIIAIMFLFAINPLEFLTSLTIVAAAIAILSKEYVTNMINGLIIMFTDQFSLGDKIKIGDNIGTISDITLLNLVLKNENDDLIIIPNNLVLSAQVVNQNPLKKKVQVFFEVPLATIITTNEIEDAISSYLLDKVEDVAELNLSVNLSDLLKDCKKFEIKVYSKLSDEQKIERIIKEALLLYIDEIKK